MFVCLLHQPADRRGVVLELVSLFFRGKSIGDKCFSPALVILLDKELLLC